MSDIISQPTGLETAADLSGEHCWALLGETEVGRLAVSVAGVPDIFPVNYTSDGESLLIKTVEGTKLRELASNHYVAFEVDGWDDDYAWSVVVRGSAAPVDEESEIREALRRGLLSWSPTPATVFVRITPLTITGRRILRGDGFRRWN